MNQLVGGGKLILYAILFCIGIFIYYTYNPEEYVAFPKCLLYHMTGFQCPSCGTQRAIYSILNGNFKDALRYNTFLILALPYAIGIIYAIIFKSNIANTLRKYLLHRYTIYTYIILYFLWWIIRNVAI